MRSYKNYLIALLAITTLASSYLAWREAQEIAELKLALAAVKPDIAARKRTWNAKRDASSASLIAARDPAGVTQADDPDAPPDLGALRHGVRAAFRGVMENPEYQKLIAIQEKGRLDRRYAALFKLLGLPPELLDKFKNLLVEKQSAILDVAIAARSEGLNPRNDPEGFRALVESTQSEIEASIRAAIGDEAYATYQNYEQTLPYRNVIDQLDARLSYGSSPLTEAQSQQLVQIVADTSQPATGSSPAVPLPLGNGMAASSNLNAEAMNRAQGILTPDQYSALEQLQQEQQAANRMRNLMRQQFQSPSSTIDTTPPPPGL